MKIEANLLPKREPIETNRAVDWFSTLEEVKTAKKRLYNPRLRTPEAQAVWNKLPGFLEKNKDLLSFCMGSEDVFVHLHGSMLPGVGTEGKEGKREKSGLLYEIRPSDIDLMVFTEEVVENDLPDYLKVHRFIEKSNFKKEFNLDGHGVVVDMLEMTEQVKEICVELLDGQELGYKKFLMLYKNAVLFGSDAFFQSKQGIEAKWRNEILKTILVKPGGDIFWDEGVRKHFNKYIAGYEKNPLMAVEDEKERHKKRVDFAYEKILTEKGVPDKKRAKDALSKQRASIQLPEFNAIKNLKGKRGVG